MDGFASEASSAVGGALVPRPEPQRLETDKPPSGFGASAMIGGSAGGAPVARPADDDDKLGANRV
jgi:hypothetical protein